MPPVELYTVDFVESITTRRNCKFWVRVTL